MSFYFLKFGYRGVELISIFLPTMIHSDCLDHCLVRIVHLVKQQSD